MAEPRVQLAVGTYEGNVAGWEAKQSAPGDMTLAYAFRAHDAPIRSLACGGKSGGWMMTGSADEEIGVYNLDKKRQAGSLTEHRAEVTAVAFAGPGHAISGDASGSLVIWRCGDWAHIHMIERAHKGRVEGIAVHPSARAALSVGSDRKVALWDLVRGKKAFESGLSAVPRGVVWGPDAKSFLVLQEMGVFVFDEGGKPTSTLLHPCRPHSLAVVEVGGSNYALVGCDDACIRVFQLGGAGEVCASRVIISGHEKRIRCVAVLPSIGDEPALFATADSDGKVRLWSIDSILDDIPTKTPESEPMPILSDPLLSLEAAKGCRITALAVTRIDPSPPKSSKQPKPKKSAPKTKKSPSNDIPSAGSKRKRVSFGENVVATVSEPANRFKDDPKPPKSKRRAKKPTKGKK